MILLISIINSTIIFSQIEITRNITIDDGLAYSGVTCAYKDSHKIMWFGTSAGLSEWNGAEFINYYVSEGLPSNFIKSICEDNNNVLYIATTKGLAVKVNNKFLTPPNLPLELKTQINQIYLNKNGVLFILSEKYGLWKKENSKFKKVKSNDNRAIIPISILERKNGKILIGTRRNGIYELRGNTLGQIIYEEFYKEYPVVDMAELNEGTLYIALQGYGLVINREDEESEKLYVTLKHGLPSKNVNDLEPTADNRLYVATTNGIAVLKNNKVIKKITQGNGLLNEFILKIFPISKDIFFFLSEGSGVYVYEENSLITFNKNNGLLHDNVWRIKELQNGAFCFLTDEGITLFKDNKFSYITTENGLGDNLVVTLYEDKNSDLYVGTYSDGINIISGNKIKRINRKAGMFENSVCTILKYKEDKIFFISRTNGIAVFNGEKIVDTLKKNDVLPNNDILSSFKKRDGTILIGVENGGLFKYNGSKFIPYFNNKENCSIWAIYEDEVGNLYLGTDEKGLIRCKPNGKRDTINVQRGLSNNTVVSIVSDNDGNIYAATDKGLNIVKFSENGKSKVRQLYKQSGLANSECNQGALYKDKLGYIWVGTIGGVTRINPDKMRYSANPTPILFASIKLMNKLIVSTDSLNDLELDYDENDISFKFAGLNYYDPQIVKYRYKLEKGNNANDSWIVDKRNEVRYTNLAPSKYRFLVSASNAWGLWSEPIEFSFLIKKPFWETWWFIFLIIITITSIIVALNNYRVKRLLEVERIRTKIASDLHDEVGSLLTQISLSADLMNYENDIEKIKERSGLIRSKSREIMSVMSDVIWSIDARNDKLENLIDRMQDFASTLLSEKEIILYFKKDITDSKKELKVDSRQNIFLIFKEAINNAVKYSGCSKIDVNISYSEKIFKMKISDNGNGLNLSKQYKGNGIKNMKMRAEKIKAKIEFINNNGLTILLQTDHI